MVEHLPLTHPGQDGNIVILSHRQPTVNGTMAVEVEPKEEEESSARDDSRGHCSQSQKCGAHGRGRGLSVDGVRESTSWTPVLSRPTAVDVASGLGMRHLGHAPVRTRKPSQLQARVKDV